MYEEYEENKLLVNDNFCIAPWISQTFRNGGEHTPCLQYDFNHGSVKKSSTHNLNKSFSMDSFQIIKEKMLCGEKVDGCFSCQVAGKHSLKEKLNKQYKSLIPSIINEKTPNPKKIKFLNLGLGNNCNLGCFSCGVQGSSLWGELYQDKHISIDWFKYIDIDDINYDLFSELEELNISGGEPLLDSKHLLFLEKLLVVNENVSINYFTNGTVGLKSSHHQLFRKFKKVVFHFSIDQVGERNSVLRYPSSWDNILSNLKTFSDYYVDIYCTVSVLNIMYMRSFIEWYDQLDFLPRKSIFFNNVFFPDFLSPMYIQESFKLKLKQMYMQNEELNAYGNLFELLTLITSVPVIEEKILSELTQRRMIRFRMFRLKTGLNITKTFREVTPFLL